MDEGRFDSITAVLAGDGGTRRRLLGGGLAAAVAGIFGAGGFGAIEAEARKRRRRRRKKQIRTRNNQQNGAPIVTNNTTLLALGDSLTNPVDVTLSAVLDALDLPDAQALIDALVDDGVSLVDATALVGTLTTTGGVACIPTSRTILALCATGNCDEGTDTCADCPDARTCGEEDNLLGEVCCVEGFVCADLGCVVDALG